MTTFSAQHMPIFADHMSVESYNHLRTPIWVFDVEKHAMWWANQSALDFWKAGSLAELLARDFSSDSETVRLRLEALTRPSTNARHVIETWTLYPNGTPETVCVSINPVRIAKGRPAILVELVDQPEMSHDRHVIRLADASRYTASTISTFSAKGDLIAQNKPARVDTRNTNDTRLQSDLAVQLGDNDTADRVLQAIVEKGFFAGEISVERNGSIDVGFITAKQGRDPTTGERIIVLTEENITRMATARQRQEQRHSELDAEIQSQARALAASEQRFRAFFDHTPAEVAIKDAEGHFLYINEILAENFGQPASALLGRRSADFLPAPIARQVEEQERLVLRSGDAYSEEIHRDIDGSPRTFHVTKFPFINPYDGQQGIGGISIDVTRQREAEKCLTKSEQILHAAVEALPLGIAVFDADGRLELYNSMFKSLLPHAAKIVEKGVTFEALIRNSTPKTWQAIGFTDQESYVQARIKTSRQTGAGWTYKQSSGRWITSVEHPTSRGGFVSIVTDITELKQQQERLDHALKVQAMGQLTGGVAHDFNNLLAVVQGNTELLISDAPPDSRKLLSEVLKAVETGAELTHRLLAFARKQVLRPEPLSLKSLIPDLVVVLQRTLGQAISVTFDLPDNVWSIDVDRAQLESALLNLAINSRDAMPKGGRIQISCENIVVDEKEETPDLKQGEYVLIRLSDTGIGMSSETIARSLEPFFTTKEQGSGSGLGLSMVYGFARQSGGSMEIESQLSKGTHVALHLPRSVADAANSKTPVKPRLHFGNGQRILVLEDNPQILQVTLLMLEKLGYCAFGAADIDDAQEHLENNTEIELVISDVVLQGGLNGFDFYKMTRSKQPKVKFIFMSGYPQSREDGSELPIGDLLLDKPFSIAELSEAVRDALRSP